MRNADADDESSAGVWLRLLATAIAAVAPVNDASAIHTKRTSWPPWRARMKPAPKGSAAKSTERTAIDFVPGLLIRGILRRGGLCFPVL